MCPFAMLLRVFRSLLGLLAPLCGLRGWSWGLFGWSGGYLELFKTYFGALGTYLELSWSLFESSWSLSEGSWRRPRLRRTFIFKNERFASTGARFSKPARARTGSELLRERMLSRGIEKRAATDSEQMRQ